MLNSSDVKDKNIRLECFKFRSRVEYYDGHVINCGLFDTLLLAQKELAKYPRDVWGEYDVSDYRYKEPDEKEIHERRNRKDTKDVHRVKRVENTEPGCFGRTLIGRRCKTD